MMPPRPTLVATSVVRGSHQGESHGGVFLVDLDSEQVTQTVDWNSVDIDWQGSGWDRGLRGIAFDAEKVFIAASDELFVYTPGFEKIASYRNPYLKHCHEIGRHERRLYLTSTGFDSILGFDLDSLRFSWGLQIVKAATGFRGVPFDPNGEQGVPAGNALHINSVFCNPGGMYIAGLRTGGLLHFDGRRINLSATLPQGVHNARPFREGVLFNDTQANVVRYATPEMQCAFRVPHYEQEKLTHTEMDDTRIARQGFGRGLCTIAENIIAAGSSPSTIALHDLASVKTKTVVTLTMDIRNAIHGLEVWPF